MVAYITVHHTYGVLLMPAIKATIAQSMAAPSFNAEAFGAGMVSLIAKRYSVLAKAQSNLARDVIKYVTDAKLPPMGRAEYDATIGEHINAKILESRAHLSKASVGQYASAIKATVLAITSGFAFTAENTPSRIQDVPAVVRDHLASKGLASATTGRKPRQAGDAKASKAKSADTRDVTLGAAASDDAVDAFEAAAEVLIGDGGREAIMALALLAKADRKRLAREVIALAKSLGK